MKFYINLLSFFFFASYTVLIAKKKHKIIPVIIIMVSIVFFAFSSGSDDIKNKLNNPTDVNAWSTYLIQFNKLILPMDNTGVIANVNIGNISEGQYDGKDFLYSGGFMMSGKDGGVLWSNGVATSSTIQDYVPGVVGMDQEDPRAHIYVVKTSDEPFGDSWLEWKDAVDMGAYFYDGDGDGVYNPVDKNSNGRWDQDEDKPDLLGDETLWCVYNDGLERPLRAFPDQDPKGIEIRQTLWGYSTPGDLENIVFIRYSLNNAGTVADVYDSVYFCVWDDVDLGGSNGYTDDLVGCDTALSVGYTYNDGPDSTYGINPPCFLVDLFQGPWVETGNPDDMAFNVKGPLLGIDTIPGALNLPLTSFVHYEQTAGDPRNPQELRNYLLGKTHNGQNIDPCTWAYGIVLGGVDCSLIPGNFMYSGDPVSLTGWINNYPTDQRQLCNTGPFLLEKNKPVDIVAAYIVGQSTSALNSVNMAKLVDRSGQILFSSNFITDVKHIDGQIPIAFKISQNYPNPFNPVTKINYQIPKLSYVTLKVYDVLGNEVITLVNEEKTTGNYEVEFDGSKLPSGVYFYSLQAGSFVETKKMILLK